MVASFSETFDTADGLPIGPLLSWTPQHNAVIFSNTLSASGWINPAGSVYGNARCDDDLDSDDMSVEFTIAAMSAEFATFRAWLRMGTGTFDDITFPDHIRVDFSSIPVTGLGGPDNVIALSYTESNAQHALAATAVQPGDTTQGMVNTTVLLAADFVPGDVIRAQVVGVDIEVYINDVLRATGTTVNVPAGRRGGLGMTYTQEDHGVAFDSFTHADVPPPPHFPVTPWPIRYEPQGLRSGRYRGDHGPIIPTVSKAGIPYLVANDRYMTIPIVSKGSESSYPEFRSWNAAPPGWGEALSVQDREQVVPFYANNEHRRPVDGILELPVRIVGGGSRSAASAGKECTIAGLFVTFVPRPTGLRDFDGGLSGSTVLGFDVEVWGVRHGDATATDIAGRTSGVIVSTRETFGIPAGSVGSVQWPNEITVWCPTVLTQRVRDLRVRFPRVRHCQIKAVEVWGHTHNRVIGTP